MEDIKKQLTEKEKELSDDRRKLLEYENSRQFAIEDMEEAKTETETIKNQIRVIEVEINKSKGGEEEKKNSVRKV